MALKADAANTVFIAKPSDMNYADAMTHLRVWLDYRKVQPSGFKITAGGKVVRTRSSRRHLLSTKNAKRKRRLAKAARVDKTDVARIKANLPFG